jgi:hypothetical protein
MQQTQDDLTITAHTRDGTAYSKKRILAILKSLESEGFETFVKRRIAK